MTSNQRLSTPRIWTDLPLRLPGQHQTVSIPTSNSYQACARQHNRDPSPSRLCLAWPRLETSETCRESTGSPETAAHAVTHRIPELARDLRSHPSWGICLPTPASTTQGHFDTQTSRQMSSILVRLCFRKSARPLEGLTAAAQTSDLVHGTGSEAQVTGSQQNSPSSPQSCMPPLFCSGFI